MTRQPLHFWFEFASTYSYPAALRVERVAAARGVPVVWRPFLLAPIFGEQGWRDSPFNIYPVKGRYMWRDLARICEKEGLPFRHPTRFPRNGLLPARVACAAIVTGRTVRRRVERQREQIEQDIAGRPGRGGGELGARERSEVRGQERALAAAPANDLARCAGGVGQAGAQQGKRLGFHNGGTRHKTLKTRALGQNCRQRLFGDETQFHQQFAEQLAGLGFFLKGDFQLILGDQSAFNQQIPPTPARRSAVALDRDLAAAIAVTRFGLGAKPGALETARGLKLDS